MQIRKAINIEDSEEAIFIARIADVLSHPVRVALYRYVKEKNQVRNDVCNKDLVAHFPYSQSSLSQHIKKLREVGLFQVEYRDKFSFYSINQNMMDQYIQMIQSL
ncbi:MAG: ArsR family transcriptional regulator [Bacteroidota bacterium]